MRTLTITCKQCGQKTSLSYVDNNSAEGEKINIVCKGCKKKYLVSVPSPKTKEGREGTLVVRPKEIPTGSIKIKLSVSNAIFSTDIESIDSKIIIGRNPRKKADDDDRSKTYLEIDGDAEISRVHCEIEKRSSNKYVLRDLGSTNHTFINNDEKPLTADGDEFILNSGDIIRIGRGTEIKIKL